MNRNIKKAINEFERMDGNSKRGLISMGDVLQVLDMVKNEDPGDQTIQGIIYGMSAGYVIGHRSKH